MKALLALAILLALPGVAAADWQPAEVYVIALVDEGLSVLAAEFAIDGLPDEAVCQIVAYWNTNLIIGEPRTGIALAFEDPLAGPIAVLGRLEFIAWEPFPDDYVMEVVPTDEGYLDLVDQNSVLYEALGGFHTFNCTSWCYCGDETPAFIGLYAEEGAWNCYQDIEVFTTPAAGSSWSALKSLY